MSNYLINEIKGSNFIMWDLNSEEIFNMNIPKNMTIKQYYEYKEAKNVIHEDLDDLPF